MSNVFKPVDLDKENTKKGLVAVLHAAVNSPVVLTLFSVIGSLFAFVVFSTTPDKRVFWLNQSVMIALFTIHQIYTPVFIGSYIMCKLAHNVKINKFTRNAEVIKKLIKDSMVYVTWFVFFGAILYSIEPRNVEEMEVSNNSISNSSVVFFSFFAFFMGYLAIKHWLDSTCEALILMRTDFNQKEAFHYLLTAKKMNKKAMPMSVITLLFTAILVYSITSDAFLSGIVIYFTHYLVASFWVYLLFGDAFPKKEEIKVSKVATLTTN